MEHEVDITVKNYVPGKTSFLGFDPIKTDLNTT
jgi:hypothetical protein